MRLWGLAAAALGVVLLAGCGGGEGKVSKSDSAPFEAALVEYLRTHSMDMKPDSFVSLEVKGNEATAQVLMAVKEDLYGMKPTWTIYYEKAEGGWRVQKVRR